MERLLLDTLRQLLLFAALIAPLEVLWPAREGQRLLRRGLAQDLAWGFTAPLLAGTASAAALGLVAWGTLAPLAAREIPWAGRLALVLLLGELGTYAWHRAAHAHPWLWRLHAVHHSATELDWLSSLRLHTLESVVHLLIANLPAALLGVDPRAALGVVFLQRLHTALVHANLRLPEGRWERWVAGPRFHRWHHAAEPEPGNYATLLPALDRLFGTFRLPAGQPPALGLAPLSSAADTRAEPASR